MDTRCGPATGVENTWPFPGQLFHLHISRHKYLIVTIHVHYIYSDLLALVSVRGRCGYYV